MTLDDVKRWVLERIEEHGPEFSFAPKQIVEAFSYTADATDFAMVPEALLHLIWEGKLVVTGPWRVRLPRPDEVKVKPPELVRLEAAREAVVRVARGYVRAPMWDGDLSAGLYQELEVVVQELEAAEEAMKP
jgi:hypothetical protein